ncbi:LacI family DNA-binding transcriptional regulator [Bacillaceae bacterium]
MQPDEAKMKKVTMADVAKKAGVSKSTVSQYLNKRYDYMSEKTRQKIEQAIKELGYQPNFVARSLKQKRTFTIGVIVANILHAFSTQVIRAIEDVCQQNDFHVIVCNADDDPGKEKKYIDMLRGKQVDGLIVFPTGGNVGLYSALVEQNFPLVFMDRIVEGLSVDTILLDNHKAAYLAVQHFIAKGHRRIGMLTTSLLRHVTPRLERIEGYKRALRDHGIPVREEYVKGLEIGELQGAMAQMLALEEPPTAILAGNDLTLMEILKFAKERGVRIPADLALIGIDDVPFAGIYTPPLTTVAQPAFAMGKQAASILLEKIRGAHEEEGAEGAGEDARPRIFRYEPELIVRRSC